MAASKVEIKSIPFPDNADIRIAIMGLAYCRLGGFFSEINFLSGIDDHELRLSVYRRARETGQIIETVVKDLRLPDSVPFSILAAHAVQTGSFRARLARNAQEKELDEMIVISGLHDGHKLREIDPPNGKSVTKLRIDNCGFYTLKMSDFPYQIYEINEQGQKIPQGQAKHIGYVLGAKIVSENGDSSVSIRHPRQDITQNLPGVVHGTSVVYDIVIDNHCTASETKCEEKSDFPFYYDFLKDRNDSDRQFTIEAQKRPPKSAEVAACNPVVNEPPDL